MFFLDSGYFLFIMPALIFAMYAQTQVKGAFEKYKRVYSRKRITGAQVAQQMLREAGIFDVQVGMSKGQLSDHYDPRSKSVNLSREIHGGTSLASLGIAAHEVGHALQHRHGYVPLSIRNSIVPVAQIGSTLAFPLFFIGLFAFPPLIDVAIILFLGAVIFQIITLPVEFNASSRAIRLLHEGGYVYSDEIGPVKKVLNAAALTYVAATIMALAQLLRLLLLANRRR